MSKDFDRKVAELAAKAAQPGSQPDAPRALARALAGPPVAEPGPTWWSYVLAIGGMTAVAAAGVVVAVTIQRAHQPGEVALGAALRPEAPNVVAQAEVVPLPGADVVRSGADEIAIHEGSVFVNARGAIRVVAMQFAVVPSDAGAFTAREDGVEVERGSVQIVALDGRELARVEAGQGWSMPSPVVVR